MIKSKFSFALVLSFCFTFLMFAQPKFTEISSKPGAFSRMGFGARGIGMGNSMTAVTSGNLVSYYNPALSPFQNDNSFQAGYSFLSLDRSLNFLSFTRRFDFYSTNDTSTVRKPRSSAGISAGIINAGVSDIDGRDNNGLKTKELSTSENQFFLSVANRFSEKLSIGIAVKFYYYSLYEDITSSGLGIDIGALYKINNEWNFAFVIADLNSKYDWDTAPVYGQNGLNSKDNFPLLKKLGVSYTNFDYKIIGSLEFENSNAGTNILRAGVEYNIFEGLFLRGGIDQFNLSNTDAPLKPALGFSYSRQLDGWVVGIDYAFMMEQYSSSDRHIIGINIIF